MKIIKIVPALAITVLCNSCDVSSSDSLILDSDRAVKSTIQPDKKNSAKSLSTGTTESQVQRDLNTEWAPFISKTPAKQAHDPFFLPRRNIKKIKYFFHINKKSSDIKDESFFENDHVFYGYIDYSNNVSITYLFNKENNNYLNNFFLMQGDYKPYESLNISYKNTVYQILEISGADNPEIFFQELISSPKITKYKGCIVQKKRSKYAMVDLTSCESDNRTDLSLYKI